ncbi:hypothetical protein [Pseudoxanthomonas wuyuanensis]|uniref:Lipoprotein n=1 Tax=Pseudoxanthomonas wuyuanensis TaxID=1073196 RepID=A0A286D3S4_9GAMM|nr:hypothetical protein [Pseudoxanthomonas wuyuanensis]KAF1722915.1 hypothetical protein CSC75_00015 [Pseudoxanthomonas wuyuanensis]SOD53287.1 hypothetical protein SAMN06296416_102333 [Pseudoxanthomonas wuyuanensis]
MRIIVPAISALLSLAGCHEKPSVTSEVRSSRDGVATLHSRATLKDGSARFQCLRSQSGRCHYLVFAEGCPDVSAGESPTADCDVKPVDSFSLVPGDEKQLPGLSRDFRHCVDAMAMPAAPQCLN